jgi:ABC-type multidrug transport system ATPase subunit
MQQQALERLKILDVAVAPDGTAAIIVLNRAIDVKPTVVWLGTALNLVEAKSNRLEVKLRAGLADRPAKIVVWAGEEPSEPFDFEPPASPALLWKILVAIVIAAAAALAIWVYVRRTRRRSAAREIPEKQQPASVELKKDLVEVKLGTPPEVLVSACANSECVLYVGPGLSAAAGLPTWSELAGQLLNQAQTSGVIGFNDAGPLHEALQKGAADDVIDVVAGASTGREAVVAQLRQAYLVRPFSEATATTHRKLKATPFCGVMTPNFDQLLENAFHIQPEHLLTPADAERLLELYGKREFFALKLHGRLDRPETVTLTSARYADATAANLPYSQFLSSLFYSRRLLFVGQSLDAIEAFLSTIPSRGAGSVHFALVEVSDAAWQAKAAALRRRFGLEVLPYPSQGGVAELHRFLDGLAAEVARRNESRAASPKGVGPAVARGRLVKVSLDNIGPFEHLELSLDKNWTVLLGDNGVGKTNILRAIAVGILGEDAQPYADRLIRAGSTEGAITLTTGLTTESQKTYRATLQRRSDGGAKISGLPARPLDAEGWLAIGFPAMRTVTWRRMNVALTEGRARPTADDLLPLVRGEADPRLDQLKQWLVNLDYLRKDEQARGSKAGQYQKVLPEFFRLVDLVTPGLKIAFHDVDAKTKQVTVTTDDGAVPLEAVSQGTQSVMGWVGILLQRLYEIYGDDDEDPTHRYALVLMDEIDAHMHPAWQQLLVKTLKDLFPNVQFVATTHSPLIVAGLTKDEMLVLRRDSTHRVEIKRPESDLAGQRVDQILTGSSFGLEGARDPDTVDELARYTALVSKFEPSSKERDELETLAKKLQVKLPPPQSTSRAREASKMIEQAMRSKLDALPAEEKKKMLEEIRAQIQEATSGSRRPQ